MTESQTTTSLSSDISESTLKMKNVVAIVALAISFTATTVITILAIKADSKERFDQLQLQLNDQKNFYSTELRLVNIRLDALEAKVNGKETEDAVRDKTLELMAKALSDIQRRK